jgi:hypothetical protein
VPRRSERPEQTCRGLDFLPPVQLPFDFQCSIFIGLARCQFVSSVLHHSFLLGFPLGIFESGAQGLPSRLELCLSTRCYVGSHVDSGCRDLHFGAEASPASYSAQMPVSFFSLGSDRPSSKRPVFPSCCDLNLCMCSSRCCS